MAQTAAQVLQEKSLYPLSFSVIVSTFLQWAHWAFITQTTVAISSWSFCLFTSTLELLFLWCPLSLMSACLELKQRAFWNFSRTKLMKDSTMVPIFPIYRPFTMYRMDKSETDLGAFYFLFRVYTAVIKCSDLQVVVSQLHAKIKDQPALDNLQEMHQHRATHCHSHFEFWKRWNEIFWDVPRISSPFCPGCLWALWCCFTPICSAACGALSRQVCVAFQIMSNQFNWAQVGSSQVPAPSNSSWASCHVA